MEQPTHLLPLKLPNGAIVQVEVRGTPERDVSALLEPLSMDELPQIINGLAQLVDKAVVHIKPETVSVEFGLEIAYEPGKVTALLVNGSVKGNLKIALEWKPK